MDSGGSTLPPIHINQKTVKRNLFSKHDNRHAFQSSGVYFGQGLGKKLVRNVVVNQHCSEDHTTWRTPVGYCSTYKDTYYKSNRQRAMSSEPLPCLEDTTTAVGIKKVNQHRFPRRYNTLPAGLKLAPSTETTEWFDSKTRAFTTPLCVLASTQQPYLKHNPWTFSYKQ